MRLLFFSLVLALVLPVFARAETCVCDCLYQRTGKISHPDYFDPAGASCQSIEGAACLGNHRGESYRGQIVNCQSGPKKVSAAHEAWMTVKNITPRRTSLPSSWVQPSSWAPPSR